MKLRLNLEIDVQDLNLDEEELSDKDLVYEKLEDEMYEKLNSIGDWCELYEFINDDDNDKAKEIVKDLLIKVINYFKTTLGKDYLFSIGYSDFKLGFLEEAVNKVIKEWGLIKK